MSEKQEHKRRYNRKLEFIAHFEKWLANEPSMLHFIKWHKWLKQKPVWDSVLCETGRNCND